MPTTLRAAAVLAVLAVTAGVWMVTRTVERARRSNDAVVHTRQVLEVAEGVTAGVAAAETAAGRAGTPAAPSAFDAASRAVAVELHRLRELTRDNPQQQARARALADAIPALLDALRARAADNGAAALKGAADAAARLEAVRATLRDLRSEELALLATRVDDDRAAVRRLEGLSLVLVATALGLVGWIGVLMGTASRRQRQMAEALRSDKQVLEAQVDARTAELRDANARLQSIIDSAADAIIVIDGTGRIERFNQSAERLFGYPAAEALGRNVSLLMPEPDHSGHDGYLARYLRNGDARIIGIGRQVTGRRRDGTTFPLHLSVGEMTVNGERRFTGVLHDLSARTTLERQLRASEARWRSVIESAVDAIVVIDAHGRVEAFNPAAARLFGHQEAEVLGRNVKMLMPEPFHSEHDVYLARHLATDVRRVIGTGREVTGLRRDGTTFPLHLSVGRMTVDGEPKFTGILHDLSTRVAIEAQLRERTSLAHLGEMAAMVAHEVKNPLAGIRGAIQVIGGRLPAGNPDGPILTEIVSRIDALNELMQDLLLFARPPQPKSGTVDLASLVASTADLLTSDPALEKVRVTIDGAAPKVAGDSDLLKIVFVNLLVNGAHAMRGQGTLRVSLTPVPGGCRVAVADQGPGIPPEVREKIFLPFFTTKPKGSGLGLPTAKRLIEAHRGTIDVTCPASGGTVITIELPGGQSGAVH